MCLVVLACGAQAGVLRVVSYPFRVSPVKLVTPAAKVVSYPVRHPVRTMKPLVFPVVHPVRFWVREHGPTLPPDPWSQDVRG